MQTRLLAPTLLCALSLASPGYGTAMLSAPRRILEAENTADGEDLHGNRTWEVETNVEQVFSNPGQFRTRYSATVSCDVGTGQEGAPFSGCGVEAKHSYTIAFTVVVPGAYELHVEQERAGQLDVEYDADCSKAEVELSPINGRYRGDGRIEDSLTLGDAETCASGPGTCFGGADCHRPFHDRSSALIRGASNGLPTAHALSFKWTSRVDCEWSSKEAVLRFGRQTDDKTNGAAHYPGDGGRDESADGHIVTVTLVSKCGDGSVEPALGEQCDDGIDNGTPGHCGIDCRRSR